MIISVLTQKEQNASWTIPIKYVVFSCARVSSYGTDVLLHGDVWGSLVALGVVSVHALLLPVGPCRWRDGAAVGAVCCYCSSLGVHPKPVHLASKRQLLLLLLLLLMLLLLLLLTIRPLMILHLWVERPSILLRPHHARLWLLRHCPLIIFRLNRRLRGKS